MMRWSFASSLIVAFICLNTRWVDSRPDHDHGGHGHGHGHGDHNHEHHHDHHHGSSQKIEKGADFAVRLMDDLHHEAGMDENIITSPISIQVALLATYLGAAGKTKEELGKYLYIKDSESEKELSSEAAYLKKVFNKKDERFSYTVASLAVGIFAQKDFPVRKEYIDDVQARFLTKVENVDFNGKEATDTINKYTSDLTKGRIPQLFPSPIDPSTQVVLLSTLYFHGVWKNDFPAANTKIEKFYTGTKDIQVPMMTDKQFVPYYHNHDLQMESIQIPFFDEDYVMGILLPHENQTLMNLTHHLTGEELHATFYKAKSASVTYKIPKVKISWAKSLKSVLEKDGLKTIFERPDFSKLTSALKPLRVTDVHHVAEIEVDEKGVVATAATAVKFSTYSHKPTPTDPLPFYVDRPFLLTIIHKPTSLILFQAFVHQPAGASA